MRKAIDLCNANMSSISNIFRNRVHAVIRNDGTTMSAVAQKMNIGQSNFSMSLNGPRISLPFAVSVAKALDISLDWLCGLGDGE